MRQLPAEPGALRGRGLRAAGGHRQEGAPGSPQLVQGHLQRIHLVEKPGREDCQGRAGFGRQVAAVALWGGGPGLRVVLAASPTRGPRWPSRQGRSVLELRERVGKTCGERKTRFRKCARPGQGHEGPFPVPLYHPANFTSRSPHHS